MSSDMPNKTSSQSMVTPQLGEHPEIEAAVFRALVKHLQDRPGVQNIDLMNLADFCRNCLSKWYAAEANAQGIDVSGLAARELLYGMPYDTWKKVHQTPATPEQLAKFNATK
jgi:uncharacterized protein